MAKKPKKIRPEAAAYGRNLRAELDRQGLGIRTLARMIDPTSIEHRRRWLNKVLKGEHLPNEANRERVAEALGVAHDALDPAEDEEEDVESRLYNDLRALIRKAVQEEVAA